MISQSHVMKKGLACTDLRPDLVAEYLNRSDDLSCQVYAGF